MPPKRKANFDDNKSPNEDKKIRQLKLFETPNASKERNDGSWEVTESLLIYTHPDVKPSSKILGLDLDHTIIDPASGNVFPKNNEDWKLISDKIVMKLKNYYDEGFKLVIMSNQSALMKRQKDVSGFQGKIENILKKLSIPMQAIFSLLNDINRKPLTGMFEWLEKYGNSSVKIDKTVSIYCGDAAGRPAEGSRKKDFSCSDRLFALNVGLRFMTPEELWFDQPSSTVFDMPSFVPLKLNTQSNKLPKLIRPANPEIILFVGYPGSGKSYFCHHHLAPLGYKIISRDDVGTWQKCIQLAEAAMKKHSYVVIDNTNMDKESRGRYVQLARKYGYLIRCFHMQTSIDHAKHNEKFRILTVPSHKPVSSMVYNMMKSKYEQPHVLEGFTEIMEIPFELDPEMENRDIYFQYLLDK